MVLTLLQHSCISSAQSKWWAFSLSGRNTLYNWLKLSPHREDFAHVGHKHEQKWHTSLTKVHTTYVRCLMPLAKLPACSPNAVSNANEELWGILSWSPNAGASNSLQTRLIFFFTILLRLLNWPATFPGLQAWHHINIRTSLEMTFWWWKTRNNCLEEEWHLEEQKGF